MSDFIFTTKKQPGNAFSKVIQGVYYEREPEVREFHGPWGSLAVSQNRYHGFAPYENGRHICLIIGGPVLYFQDNAFLAGGSGQAGTKAVYERWVMEEAITWDEDLSGPFVALLLDKKQGTLDIVTDLLSFIPVFKNGGGGSDADARHQTIGTHVDMVAAASGGDQQLDLVSVGDFILNGIVTYPYTFYKGINQLRPGSIHSFIVEDRSEDNHSVVTYWQPEEAAAGDDKEATAIREALIEYMEKVTAGMSTVGCFVSGGEDSRVVLAALPDNVDKHGYIFLDQMNREGQIAQQASAIYGADFHLKTRDSTYYLDILPRAAKLIGSGFEFTHSHSYKFAGELDTYPAVFGGLYSDALLKGSRITTKRAVPLPLFPYKKSDPTAGPEITSSFLQPSILSEINRRRRDHLQRVRQIRPGSVREWFHLWPISMNNNVGNLHCNRRLFKSYEPFLSHKIVKIAAAATQRWKLNRRMFQKAVKPLLKKSRWLQHGQGSLPYFPWPVNSVIEPLVRRLRRPSSKGGNQGPWTEWERLLDKKEAGQAFQQYRKGFRKFQSIIREPNLPKAREGKTLSSLQKMNLLQVSYLLDDPGDDNNLTR